MSSVCSSTALNWWKKKPQGLCSLNHVFCSTDWSFSWHCYILMSLHSQDTFHILLFAFLVNIICLKDPHGNFYTFLKTCFRNIHYVQFSEMSLLGSVLLLKTMLNNFSLPGPVPELLTEICFTALGPTLPNGYKWKPAVLRFILQLITNHYCFLLMVYQLTRHLFDAFWYFG